MSYFSSFIFGECFHINSFCPQIFSDHVDSAVPSSLTSTVPSGQITTIYTPYTYPCSTTVCWLSMTLISFHFLPARIITSYLQRWNPELFFLSPVVRKTSCVSKRYDCLESQCCFCGVYITYYIVLCGKNRPVRLTTRRYGWNVGHFN